MFRETEPPAAQVLERTQHWLEKAVIGLHLCPFAAPVYRRGLVHFVVSLARTEVELESDLSEELIRLRDTPSEIIETTLLIHPWVLNDFLDYNDFLEVADAILEELELSDDIQLATFHPNYCFAGEAPDDITHYTNRSPYPALHLLRQSSVTQAVDSVPDTAAIPEINQQTLRQLGHSGWDELGI